MGACCMGPPTVKAFPGTKRPGKPDVYARTISYIIKCFVAIE